jgi:glycosyltransferase involved in cell wall biosynthesis
MTIALPFVSVIVATYRRPASLARCLEQLTRADYPRDCFEVVVVDDGGDIDLAPVCAPFGESVTLRLLRQVNSGAAAARNLGANAARGDVLLFTDDDCLVQEGWIRACVEATRRRSDALVGGRTVNALPDNLYAEASQLLVNWLSRPCVTGEPAFVASNNLATSRTAFESAGGFDPIFRTSAGEDRELSARFREMGRPLVFHFDAVVEHANPLTCRAFIRQHANFGRAAFRLRMHPAPRTGALPFGGPAFYLGLLLIPVDVAPGRWRWPRVATVRCLLALAQLANGAGFVIEGLRPRVRVIKAAPVPLRPR